MRIIAERSERVGKRYTAERIEVEDDTVHAGTAEARAMMDIALDFARASEAGRSLSARANAGGGAESGTINHLPG